MYSRNFIESYLFGTFEENIMFYVRLFLQNVESKLSESMKDDFFYQELLLLLTKVYMDLPKNILMQNLFQNFLSILGFNLIFFILKKLIRTCLQTRLSAKLKNC